MEIRELLAVVVGFVAHTLVFLISHGLNLVSGHNLLFLVSCGELVQVLADDARLLIRGLRVLGLLVTNRILGIVLSNRHLIVHGESHPAFCREEHH